MISRSLLLLLVSALGCRNSPEALDRPTAVPTAATLSPTVEPVTLKSHRWKHRPLLVFVPKANDELEQHRARWRGAASGVRERDMWLGEVIGDQVYCEGVWCGTASALRARFNPEGPSTVVLVGKDGGEKLRGSELLPEEVFRRIDQMPMRRREAETQRKP